MIPIALTIAGSDPSGGAGIQADLKTFHQFAVYGEAAITLVTVQNTSGVSRVELMSPQLIREQVQAVLADMPPQAAKTGALGGVEQVEAVTDLAAKFPFPLVVDPVMISKHGSRLMSDDAQSVLVSRLLPVCTLVTPNVSEAESLSGRRIETLGDAETAAHHIAAFGPKAVLVKGGHLLDTPVDVLWAAGQIYHFPGSRVNTRHTHGTGCTYSAAITALLAAGRSLHDAIEQAKKFIQAAIETAPGLGRGCGPVNHFAR